MASDPAIELQTIGRNVKLARVGRGWTQEQLAFALGESGSTADRGYISRLETGQHNPSAMTLVRLGRALGIAPATLLDGVE